MKHRNLEDLSRANVILEHVRKDLARIERYFEPALTGPGSVDESGIRATGRSEPVQLDVLDVRNDAMHDMHFWARFILDEVNGGTIQTRVDARLADIAQFIARWTPALTEQFPDDAEQLEQDMRTNANRLEALAKGWRTKRVEVGKCPEQILVQQEDSERRLVEIFKPCTGTLWAVVKVQDAMLPKVIVCDQEGEHSWNAYQWAALGRRLGKEIA